ncbi:PilN domain-containing protein [Noviherbaspirillum sp. ST9]|uniref:PilN domain-containing protein n=1 Tax=Noviherbaspirillum sp. ST9 TaxID=3401606 RepID=UPI003B58B035
MSQQINLFSPVFLQKQKYFSSIAIAQATAVLLVAAIGMSAYTEYKLEALVREAKASDDRLARTAVQLKEVTSQATPKEKSKALEEQLKRAELELKAEERVRDFLKTGELGNTHGYSEFFRAFSRQIGEGIWLTGFTIVGPGAEMSVDGRAVRADLIPAYIGRLRAEPVMQGKTFAAIDMKSVQPAPKLPPAQPGAAQPAQPAPVPGPQSLPKPPSYIEFSLVSSGLKPRLADAQGAAIPGQILPSSIGEMK